MNALSKSAAGLAIGLRSQAALRSISQNPTTAESRLQDLLPKGTGMNPTLSALAGNDSSPTNPSVKHIVSKEMILYYEKTQAAILDEVPDEEVFWLRQAALGSVRDNLGLCQLAPYFNYIMDHVTHQLDDTFTLKQMMELTNALIENKSPFLDRAWDMSRGSVVQTPEEEDWVSLFFSHITSFAHGPKANPMSTESPKVVDRLRPTPQDTTAASSLVQVSELATTPEAATTKTPLTTAAVKQKIRASIDTAVQSLPAAAVTEQKGPLAIQANQKQHHSSRLQ